MAEWKNWYRDEPKEAGWYPVLCIVDRWKRQEWLTTAFWAGDGWADEPDAVLWWTERFETREAADAAYLTIPEPESI